MITNTILLITSLIALIALQVFLVFDWWWAFTNQDTFTGFCYRVLERNMYYPLFWIWLGASIGFSIALVLGFVLGHLFWLYKP